MARTFDEIHQAILDAKSAETGLNSLNSTSQTAIWRLWAYITAMCQFIIEQYVDNKQTEIETAIAAAAVGSEAWVQAKAFEFQYDALVPQVLTLVNFAPQYNPIDVTKRIITRASVKTGTNATVSVKVAKSEPPVALSAPELAALQSYLTDGGDGTYAGRSVGLGFAGINYVASSTDADELYIAGTVYYNGQYAGSIQDTVIAAIEAYLAALPFDGSVSLLGITDAIQSVTGVTDILLTDVAIRANATAFGSKTYMRQNKTDIITVNPTFAGYVIQETTSGETFADRITFSAS